MTHRASYQEVWGSVQPSSNALSLVTYLWASKEVTYHLSDTVISLACYTATGLCRYKVRRGACRCSRCAPHI
jgi:hypothetical protein